MNFIETIGWFLAGKVGDIVANTRDSVAAMRRLVIVTLAVPIVIILVAFLLGHRADVALDEAGARTAQVMIALGAVIGSVSAAFLWARATVLLYGIWIGSKAASIVTDNVPTLSQGDADKVSAWARGIIAWVCGAYLLLLILNRYDAVWRHLGAFSIMVAIGALLMMAANWAKPVWGKPAIFYGVVVLFAVNVVSYVSPDFARVSDAAARKYMGTGEFSMLTNAKEREAMAIDKTYLQKLLDEQIAIRRRATDLCAGQLCANDEAKFRANEAKIEAVKAGTYLETATPPPSKAKSAETDKPSAPDGLDQPKHGTRPTKAKRPIPPPDDDVWSELNKFRPPFSE